MQKSEISRLRTTSVKPDLSQLPIVRMPSRASPAQKLRMYGPVAMFIAPLKTLTLLQAERIEVKDDRPADNISFAATNLVKPGIQSRQAEQSGRGVFPPTPPPENDRPSRGNSVRNGARPMPQKLTIQTQYPNRKYERASPEEARSTKSASSSGPSRGFSGRRDPPPMQRRPTRRIEEEDEADPADLYDMYQGGSRMSRDSPSSRSRQPRYVDDDGSDYDDYSDGPEFEMVSNNRRVQSSRSGSRSSRRSDIRKIRVKVHAGDVRYLMIGTAVEYPDLVDRIKDKFGMRRRFKIKVRDEDTPQGDMITLGDQDDLDMAIQASVSLARRQRQDSAKMEVSVTMALSDDHMPTYI